MEYGNLTEFVEEHPEANRLGLVRIIPTTFVELEIAQPFSS